MEEMRSGNRAIRIVVVLVIACVAMFVVDGVAGHPAWGIVIDRNNQIYFSDIETIWKIDAEGKLAVFRSGVSRGTFMAQTAGGDGTPVTRSATTADHRYGLLFVLLFAGLAVVALIVSIWNAGKRSSQRH
jgi:hypothetical protein